MKKINRFSMLSFFLIATYLLNACGGTLPPSTAVQAQKVEANEVVFTGIVEAINRGQWTVSGQQVTVDTQTTLDPNIAVGDTVRVEANVSADGAVTALKVESSVPDDTASNSNTANDNGIPDNTNTDAGNANDSTANDNSNSANDNGSNVNGDDNGNEVFGIVEAITTESIIVNGVAYSLADFTEFKDAIAVGDQVKIHVIVNADGTFTIREIEQSAGQGVDDNTNGNDNSNDANSNDDASNSNSDDDNNGNDNGDDHGKDNNGNGNDDNKGSNDNDD